MDQWKLKKKEMQFFVTSLFDLSNKLASSVVMVGVEFIRTAAPRAGTKNTSLSVAELGVVFLGGSRATDSRDAAPASGIDSNEDDRARGKY